MVAADDPWWLESPQHQLDVEWPLVLTQRLRKTQGLPPAIPRAVGLSVAF